MAIETREEFMAVWLELADELVAKPDDQAEAQKLAKMIEESGEAMYATRGILDRTGSEALNLTAHRFFHGVGLTELSFFTQLPQVEAIPFVMGEYMFHLGFAMATAYASRPDSAVGMADEEDVAECIKERAAFIRSGDELREKLLPFPLEMLRDYSRAVVAAQAQAEFGAAKEAPEGSEPPAGGGGYW